MWLWSKQDPDTSPRGTHGRMLRVSTAVVRQAHVGQVTVAWTDCKTINLSQSHTERIPVEKHSKSVFSLTENPCLHFSFSLKCLGSRRTGNDRKKHTATCACTCLQSPRFSRWEATQRPFPCSRTKRLELCFAFVSHWVCSPLPDDHIKSDFSGESTGRTLWQNSKQDLYIWNKHNIVNQLESSMKQKFFLKKDKTHALRVHSSTIYNSPDREAT